MTFRIVECLEAGRAGTALRVGADGTISAERRSADVARRRTR